MGREGLASFGSGDIAGYLEEAMLLLESGWLERSADITSPWRTSIKRAAEIIEWLSQSQLKPPGAPLHLLAAAAFQLADYPAMALGHLRRLPEGEPLSEILRQFVRARSEEHTSELQSLMRISYAVFCLKKKKQQKRDKRT